MREVIVTSWCDNCALKGERTRIESAPVALSLGTSKPQKIDLCESCEKELLEPLRVLLAEYGQPVEVESGQALICPSCDKTYKKRNSLAKHMERQHQQKLDAMGRPVALDDTEQTPDEGQHQCPDCPRSFATPQGLGAHRFRHHDYVSPTKEAREAKAKAKA